MANPKKTTGKTGSGGSGDALTFVSKALDTGKAALEALKVPVPPPPVSRLQKAGTLLQRLVDLRRSVHSDLDELFGQIHATREALAVELKERGIEPHHLELHDMDEVITTLERWASDSKARAADFTSEKLAHAGRRENFLGYLVQHLLIQHRQVVPVFAQRAELAAAGVRKALGEGSLLVDACGNLVPPPAGTISQPRRGVDVEIWDGKQWQSATDYIAYSEHLDAVTGAVIGHHWLLEVEIKKGHVDPSQFRKRPARLVDGYPVRWRRLNELGEKGDFVEVKDPHRIYVNTDPVSKILLVGNVPPRAGQAEAVEFARMRGQLGWERYLRWDARLNLPVVRELYELVR